MLKEEALYGLFLEVKGPHGEVIKEKERIGELGSKEEKEQERKHLQDVSPKNGNNYNWYTVEFFGNSSYDNTENPDKITEDIDDLPTEVEIEYASLDADVLEYYDFDEAIKQYLQKTYSGIVEDFGYYWYDVDTILVHDIKWSSEKDLHEDKLLEYTTYWFGEREYPSKKVDHGEYDPHTGEFADGTTLDDLEDWELEEKLNESVEDDFWHLRDLKEPKYGTGNLVIDGNKIRPLTKDELKFKFAVSIEHADKGDFKTKEELIDFAKKTDAEKIMFYFEPGDNYSGEYSFLYSDEDKVRDIWKKYKQYAYAKYGENGEYHEITESLKEYIDEYKFRDILEEKGLYELSKLVDEYSSCITGEECDSIKEKVLKLIKSNKLEDKLLYDVSSYFDIDNLEEDIEKHDTLNDKVFDIETQEMLPEVREKLTEIVNHFVDAVHEDELDLEVLDYVLVGSNANYNYTKDSDLDVHIIASSKPDCNKKHLNQIYQVYKSVFNKNHDITIHDIPVELYVEMDKVTARSGGVYSIKDNKWLKQPKQVEVPDIDYDAFYREFKNWEERYLDLVNNLDEYENASEEVEKYIDDIYDIRQKGIAEEGEFSISNLVFKETRNRGYLDKLKELKTELESKELSLESVDK